MTPHKICFYAEISDKDKVFSFPNFGNLVLRQLGNRAASVYSLVQDFIDIRMTVWLFLNKEKKRLAVW